jgi:hypothetical protein
VRVPNLPHPDAPTARRATGSSCAPSATGRVRLRGARPRRPPGPPPARSTSRVAPRSRGRGSPTSRGRPRCSSSRWSATPSTSRRHGHVPVIPPVLVRREAMYGTGFLPTDEQQIFRTDDRDDLYLVGTAEVPLAGMHLDEILDEVPVRYAGFSTCFRREAGAHGKDTRGILRVHQFDKVELFSFVAPEDSDAEHERLLAIEEDIFSGLGCTTRWSTSRSATSGRRRRASSTSRRGCRASRPSARSPRPRTRPTTRHAAGLPVPHRRTAATRWSTRSTAPRWPCSGRSSRSSRPTSGPTGRSPCPPALQPHLGTDVLFAR